MTTQQAMELAIQHHQTGQLAEAESLYRQILSHDPANADALHRLGTLAYQVGQLAPAAELIGRAIQVQPNIAEYHSNLGLVLASQRKYDRAVACYQTAIRLKPDLADAHYNFGNAMLDLGKLDEAITAYRKALSFKPDIVGAYNNLGSALKSQGLLDESIECYRRAISISNYNPVSHSNLLYALHFHPRYDAQAIFQEHRAWNAKYAAPLKQLIQPFPDNQNPKQRLRVGYVSPDLRDHPIARFLLPLLENHDRNAIEAICYSDVSEPDEMTNRLRHNSHYWRSIVGMKDEQVAKLIREDKIDILVDLTMHMSRSRLLVFAQKPAPVQATYLAYCSTTGLDTIDWRISDPYLDPPGSDQSCYSERTLRLPQTYWCYQSSTEIREVSPLPAIKNAGVTFACLNNFAKVTTEALNAWCDLLQNCANSRLIIHAREGNHRERVQSLFRSRGIDPSRLQFADYAISSEYFAFYDSVDIALDPFPYNGGTTTCDALWMGVPVVSLCGQTAVGRAGLSLLSNIGLPEWVARSAEQYISIATNLAHNIDQLAVLRSSLRERMKASPLMDGPRFARQMEAAYQTMWQARR